MKAKNAPEPYQQALGLLVRRERSRSELARKLASKGADPVAVESALDRLAGQGYLSDARYAEAFARSRASAGYGPVRIRAELAQHALGDEQIQSALAACEINWAESAFEVAARRYTQAALRDSDGQRKAVAFLLRRGFSQGDAYAAVRAVGQGSAR